MPEELKMLPVDPENKEELVDIVTSRELRVFALAAIDFRRPPEWLPSLKKKKGDGKIK